MQVTQRIRILLVDDHAMVRQALAAVLEEERTIEIVGQAGNRRSAIEMVRECKPDVVVLDYNLPDGSAIDVLEDLQRGQLETRVLVLTVHENLHYAVRALECGASGFLVKKGAVEELVSAIQAVQKGELFVAPEMSSPVFDQLRRPRRERVGVAALSPREFDLMRAMARGLGIKEVARELKVSVSSASTYRARVLEKLGLSSTGDLIRYAIENRIVE